MDEPNLDSQKGKGKVKGKAKANSATTESKFKWTLPITIKFFESLKAFKMKNGYDASYIWQEICDDFLTKSKLELTIKTAQNKYNTQKKVWINWGKIRHLETGIGWDESTGRIVADEEWWLKKKMELGTDYYQFKKKGVNPELSDLWDDVYNDNVASGKHAVAATMTVNNFPLLTGNEEVVLSDNDSMEGENANDEDNMDFITNLNSQTPSSSSQAPQSQAGSRKDTSKTGNHERKRRRRPLSTAAVMQEKISSLAESGKEMIALMRKDLEGSNDKAYDEGIEVLDRLVDSELIVGGSREWCFALTELLKPDKLRCFMKIKNDEYRAKWIENEFEREMGSEK